MQVYFHPRDKDGQLREQEDYDLDTGTLENELAMLDIMAVRYKMRPEHVAEKREEIKAKWKKS